MLLFTRDTHVDRFSRDPKRLHIYEHNIETVSFLSWYSCFFIGRALASSLPVYLCPLIKYDGICRGCLVQNLDILAPLLEPLDTTPVDSITVSCPWVQRLGRGNNHLSIALAEASR